MKVKEFKKLKVGDKVRIVSKAPDGNWNARMNKWLGKIMTVKAIMNDCNRVCMEEDRGECRWHATNGWHWEPHMIAEKIEPVKEVKRFAKVGEYIKIVDADPISADYKNGDIFKVKDFGLFRGNCRVDKSKVNYRGSSTEEFYPISFREYVVLENYIPEENAVKEVKRKAKVGEYVKIVNPKVTFGHYKEGDILEVHGVRENGGVDVWGTDGADAYVFYKEYVVLENYIPEDKPVEPQGLRAEITAIDELHETKPADQPTIVEHLIKDRKTIVKLSNGKVGVAVCSPEDEFDEYEGLRLAIARAYGKAEPYKKASEVKEVKRQANVGEYIKIVNPSAFTNCAYKKGDILQVYKIAGCRGVFCELSEKTKSYENDNGNIIILNYEYVVLENYKPTDKEVERHAKVGEYIKIVKPDPFLADYKKGQIFKVIESNVGSSIVRVSSTEAKVRTMSIYKDGYPIRDDEYVVLENYKPKK